MDDDDMRMLHEGHKRPGEFTTRLCRSQPLTLRQVTNSRCCSSTRTSIICRSCFTTWERSLAWRPNSTWYELRAINRGSSNLSTLRRVHSTQVFWIKPWSRASAKERATVLCCSRPTRSTSSKPSRRWRPMPWWRCCPSTTRYITEDAPILKADPL